MQDILASYRGEGYDDVLRNVVRELMIEHEGNEEARVNIGFHYGMRLATAGKYDSAIQTLRAARATAQAISGDHPAIAGIDQMLADIDEEQGGT